MVMKTCEMRLEYVACQVESFRSVFQETALLKEHDLVVVTEDLPELAVRCGDIGTVVHIYCDNAAFEVEFVSSTGQTIGTATLPASKIRENLTGL